jgi:peroxiredoxin
MLGRPAPSFRLTDVLSGKAVSLEDMRGRTVVLHFGASW